MKPVFPIGVVLIVLGIVALVYQGITYTQHKELFSIGKTDVTVPQEKTVFFPRALGVIALVGGITLVAVGAKK